MSYTKKDFIEELSRALTNLYDPARLRKSWLLEVFHLSSARNPQFALNELLRKGIHALEPDRNTPRDTNAWRIYEILIKRYVEQTKQQQVAEELGFSTRQMRRHEKQAIRVLADYLWNRYGLEQELMRTQSPARGGEADEVEMTPSREQELAWLKESFPSEVTDIAKVINTTLRNITPLMEAYQVHVQVDLPEDRPPITAQMTPLRQAMLNLFTAAIHSAPQGRVTVKVIAEREGIVVRVQAEAEGPISEKERKQITEELEMTGRLVRLMGAQLDIQTRQQLFAHLFLPSVEQIAVLVVDDNTDTLRLLRRYLGGTHYQFIGASDAQQALALAEEYMPRIIVLDVMLPDVDGWELLSRMRENPRLQHTSIIVSTILPQEQVAQTLGAAAFLRKPVTRQALLAALDRLTGPCLKTD